MEKQHNLEKKSTWPWTMRKTISTIYIPIATILFTTIVSYNSNQKAIILEQKLKIKKETYEVFLTSWANYMFAQDGEITKEFQSSRLRLLLYSDDETIKEFIKAMPRETKNLYNINDPVSILLYAIRKEVNPESTIKREELAGIDPSQWAMRLYRTPKNSSR